MGKTRDLFKEIKEMIGSRISSCGDIKLSTGRMVSEEKYIKKRCQKYTENLYRRDANINDIYMRMHPISIPIQYLCRKNNARCPEKVG